MCKPHSIFFPFSYWLRHGATLKATENTVWLFNRVTSKTTLLKTTFPLQRDDIRLGQNKSRIEPHLFTFFSGKKIFSCHRDCTADVFNRDMLAAKPDGGTMRPL